MLNVPVVTQWQWQIRTPNVYRYLPEQYIDEFFNTGKIRLSSFAQFAAYADEERGDPKEGRNILTGIGTKSTIFAATGHGFDAYILCGSAIFTPETMAAFGATAAIQVLDTTAFGIAIGQKLVGLKGAIEGSCSYYDGPIRVDIGDFEVDQLKTEDGKNMSTDEMLGFVQSMASSEVFFRKAGQIPASERISHCMDNGSANQ